MRNVSTTLLNLLKGGSTFLMADLYTFKTTYGTTLYYTSAPNDVTFGGNTYSSSGLLISRSSAKWVTGIEVDSMTINLQSDNSVTISGNPIFNAIIEGFIDGCQVTVSRLFFSDWNTPVDSILIFSGKVTNSVSYRNSAELTIASDLYDLNIQMPKNIYTATCSHNLYDAGCTVNKSSFTVSASVLSVNSDGSIVVPSGGQPDGYYNMGGLQFTSGLNAGLTRTIKSYASNTVKFTAPFPNVVSAGDAFIAYPGCDKVLNGTCSTVFNNTKNFRGFPYIPVPETAI